MPLNPSQMACLSKSGETEFKLLTCAGDGERAADAAKQAAIDSSDARTRSDQESQKPAEHRRLEWLAQPLRDVGIDVATSVSSHSDVYQGLLDEAAQWRADLIVLGVGEPASIASPQLAAIGRDLLPRCHCPVLLVRKAGAGPYRTALAAVDPLHGHNEPPGLDKEILEVADQFSRAFDATLSVTSIYPDPGEYEIASSIEVEPGIFYGTENFEETHRKAVDELIAECEIDVAETILRPGKPAPVIIDLAEKQNFDVIILGAIKRSALEAAILGSTAETVIAEAPCDILLVQAPHKPE